MRNLAFIACSILFHALLLHASFFYQSTPKELVIEVTDIILKQRAQGDAGSEGSFAATQDGLDNKRLTAEITNHFKKYLKEMIGNVTYDVKALVYIKLDKTGKILSGDIKKFSGNTGFRDILDRAMYSASPYPMVESLWHENISYALPIELIQD